LGYPKSATVARARSVLKSGANTTSSEPAIATATIAAAILSIIILEIPFLKRRAGWRGSFPRNSCTGRSGFAGFQEAVTDPQKATPSGSKYPVPPAPDAGPLKSPNRPVAGLTPSKCELVHTRGETKQRGRQLRRPYSPNGAAIIAKETTPAARAGITEAVMGIRPPRREQLIVPGRSDSRICIGESAERLRR
jgi:hypothetical protein